MVIFKKKFFSGLYHHASVRNYILFRDNAIIDMILCGKVFCTLTIYRIFIFARVVFIKFD